ncbi:unnamed protein product [Soboliphyme baturini]|uniref:Secreted protein n=1 Tax=Soboliphyme baturini TaxID=241478 RepID=A0A183J196_9BILA|nr:unnamed protein product [Soboliphyme baturini]
MVCISWSTCETCITLLMWTGSSFVKNRCHVTSIPRYSGKLRHVSGTTTAFKVDSTMMDFAEILTARIFRNFSTENVNMGSMLNISVKIMIR